ncbi:MAG: type II toxin-antitoxin system VapC family toxin [Mycobacteriales bacterium]
MSLVVMDACAMVAFYAADDPRHSQVTARLSAGHALFAPTHFDVEVISAVRSLARNNPLFSAAVPAALGHLAGFPIRRMPLAPLLQRMWQLRENITPYDAAYLALTEQLGGSLVTCDVKLTQSPGAECDFDIIR